MAVAPFRVRSQLSDPAAQALEPRLTVLIEQVIALIEEPIVEIGDVIAGQRAQSGREELALLASHVLALQLEEFPQGRGERFIRVSTSADAIAKHLAKSPGPFREVPVLGKKIGYCLGGRRIPALQQTVEEILFRVMALVRIAGEVLVSQEQQIRIYRGAAVEPQQLILEKVEQPGEIAVLETKHEDGV